MVLHVGGTKAPVLGAQDFPPLPSASAGDQGGYNRPFRRYSLEEFAAIISRAPEKTIRRPMLPSDPELFLSEPNLTLELEKERPSYVIVSFFSPSLCVATNEAIYFGNKI